jgi:hypothetical protein
MKQWRGGKWILLSAALIVAMAVVGCDSDDDDDDIDDPAFVVDYNRLTAGLENPHLRAYDGVGDGGVAHVDYWTLAAGSPEYEALDPEEQAKVDLIQTNQIHSVLFQPDQRVAGREVTGLLDTAGRRQTVVLKVPDDWNGDLVVAGTPGLRNHYANEAVFVPWLVDQGYAYVTGDKGLINGSDTMFTGEHPTRHWGMMMLDLAQWAEARIEAALGRAVERTYAVGLSNGGYQVRRALEIDHAAVADGAERTFHGGVDWSGAYWPGERVLDTNEDGTVSVAEYASANSLIGSIDRATVAMGWAYSPDTETTPENWAADPPYPGARDVMLDSGFTPESAVYWAYYNTLFDSFKSVLPTFKGVGYYNLVSYVYKAELRGDTAETAAAYTTYVDPENPDAEPPLYDWLAASDHLGWNGESVRWALENANTGEFSAPMITVAGKADALVAYEAQAVAYADLVSRYGNPDLHRLYTIENAGHVDAHADGTGDFDFNGVPGDEGMADRLTPMQAYVMKAFTYLVEWVEQGEAPPASRTIPTDPTRDAVDPEEIAGFGTVVARR